jgi:hypothetical protein
MQVDKPPVVSDLQDALFEVTALTGQEIDAEHILEPTWIEVPVKISCALCGWTGIGRDAPEHPCEVRNEVTA